MWSQVDAEVPFDPVDQQMSDEADGRRLVGARGLWTRCGRPEGCRWTGMWVLLRTEVGRHPEKMMEHGGVLPSQVLYNSGG